MGVHKNEQQESALAALRTRLNGRAVVLVGMPGSGKSSIGRRLAQRMGLKFVDVDAHIEEAANGMSIAEIFAKHGEPEFRSLEARVISRLLDQGQTVVATGGGAFMSAETRERVRESGISIWLSADLDVLLRRVKRKNDRPLLRGDKPEAVLKRLLSEREPTYAKANITVISRDVPHDEVVDTIVEALSEYLEPETDELRS